jgi:hypothetical protein
MKLDIKYYPPYAGGRRCFELKRILNQAQEVYPFFAQMFNGCNIAEYPDFLSSVLNFKASERWHDWHGGVGFVKGASGFPESDVEPALFFNEDEVFTYDEDGKSIVPLVHFYEVVLLHAMEVLRIVKAEDILSYWKNKEPHRYRENWESEMNRLLDLIRQAWENERSK